ncbi:MAG: hypothetical protein QOI41_6336 [Myxococcales bacterium]|nr:hypothetical protein [Myxococcales bacterium]
MNRRLAWLLGSGVLVTWGLAGALGGCGSTEATVDGSNADGGEAGTGTSGGTSGATSGGTSGSTSGGTADGGTDGSSTTDGGGNDGGGTEGGLGSTPDKVACGGGPACTAPTDVCCVKNTGDAGCQPAADQCQNGVKLHCDEKADCTGTDVCCGGFVGGAGATECKSNCSGNQVQVCKTNAECTGGTCYVNTCPSLGGGTIVIPSCTALPTPCTH